MSMFLSGNYSHVSNRSMAGSKPTATVYMSHLAFLLGIVERVKPPTDSVYSMTRVFRAQPEFEFIVARFMVFSTCSDFQFVIPAKAGIHTIELLTRRNIPLQ
jgi:hypothetical protein